MLMGYLSRWPCRVPIELAILAVNGTALSECHRAVYCSWRESSQVLSIIALTLSTECLPGYLLADVTH